MGIRGYNLFAYCGNSPVFRLDPNGRASIGAEEDGDPTNDTVSEKEGGGTGVNPGNTNITSTSFGNGTSADTTISTSQAPGQAAANSTHIQLTADGTNRVKSHTTYNQYGLPAQRIDYIGRAHGGIKTPHVHTYSYIVRGDNVYRDGHDIRPYVSVK